MENLVFIGDWIKDRVLGSGSFGVVVLWKHQKTQERLAIKTCKWGDELTEKHKERWTKEVEMLQNCQNPNIVGTKQLPPEFKEGLKPVNPSKLPILCMEYCAGGNLRQYLNLPESCNGLREVQVRQILGDMRSALQFLHHNKITHRDVKPENIVIHVLDGPGNMDNGLQGKKKVIYKLIDLGYAKEIDSNSVCASFVGTLQYLAPEIFYSKTYSNSVDFWSFGLLAFEVICGTRPFLPFMAPVQWMAHVKVKTHDNICIYETFHGDIKCSNEMFPENFISKPLKASLEQWLKVALEWDPKLRGRDAPSKVTFNIPSEEKETSSNVVIFNLLETILSKKIMKVFSVATLTHYAYEIDDKTTAFMLKKWIQDDTHIPVEEQILISQNYVITDGEDTVMKYWDENSISVYLYNKQYLIEEKSDIIVPEIVQRSLKPSLPVELIQNFKNCQLLHRNGFYFVMSQMELYDSLIKGLFVRAESLKNESKELVLRHNFVDKNIGKLHVKEETLKKFTTMGKEHVQNLKANGVGTNLLGGFEKLFKEADELSDDISKLQNAWSQLTVRLESAARRRIEGLSTDLNNFISKFNYQALFTKGQTVYVSYKKIENYNDSKGRDKISDVIQLIKDCFKLRNKILMEIRNQRFYCSIKDLSIELSKISEIITNASNFSETLDSHSNSLTDKLSNCMWSTISLLSSDAHNLVDLPYSVVSIQKSNFKIGEPVSTHCMKMVQSTNRVEEDENLKSLIEESLTLRQNHIKLTEKFKTSKNYLHNKAKLDFSFLAED
ncbi:inhibitor of nuclear factor kappa-B kinase subunit alpha [Ostrinia nubilalis]|uniref:inhibitor of nuclear factor kappa-B kinase subunit alpha n=1 Tax=Ostrinia nubilalis TaxID=29057 RepID=UPI00308223AA